MFNIHTRNTSRVSAFVRYFLMFQLAYRNAFIFIINDIIARRQLGNGIHRLRFSLGVVPVPIWMNSHVRFQCRKSGMGNVEV